MSRILDETPFDAPIVPASAVIVREFTGWQGQVELHWCEGCGLLIKNGALIIHPPGADTKAMWFCDSKCKTKFDKKGPYFTHNIYPYEDGYE